EKNYTFELVTTNAELGNRGIPLEVNTRVYGENFQESLLNRKVQFAIREAINSPLRISWHGAVENSVGINIIYQNNLGAEVNMTIPAEESLTVLPDYKEGLRFRTVFLPEPTAVDEFYTGFRDISQLVEIPISKS